MNFNFTKLIQIGYRAIFASNSFQKLESRGKPMIVLTPVPTEQSLQLTSSPKLENKKSRIFGITFSLIGLGLAFNKIKEWNGSPFRFPIKVNCEAKKLDPKYGHKKEEEVLSASADEILHEEQESKRDNWGKCLEPEKPCCPYPDPPKCEGTCLNDLECVEECIAKANSDLEVVLMETKTQAQCKTGEALKLLCESRELSEEFIRKGYEAISSDSPEAYCEAYAIAVRRCEVVSKALSTSDCAWELLIRLRTAVETGKCCQYTHCNPLLITSEQFVECAERELVNARAGFDCVHACTETSCRFCDVVAKFKAGLQSEVPIECECDCGSLMKVAYKKVLNMQKEVALQKICSKVIEKPKGFEEPKPSGEGEEAKVEEPAEAEGSLEEEEAATEESK